MTSNMYRVGDYVYFETSSSSPYQIRRIEELSKTPAGNVEAKVMCFYRRRDLPNQLIQLADKHHCVFEEPSSNNSVECNTSVATSSIDAAQTSNNNNGNNICPVRNNLNEVTNSKQRHQMKHRELFLSRQVETLPATHIRGKCSVTLFNETESLLSYINKEDMFFYCLVFDPNQKTLLADKGEIRVGNRYQCEVGPFVNPADSTTEELREQREYEELLWTPQHNLTDRQIDQFLVVSRSVGTFARALDCSSSVKQPSLHMSAAAASRDITLFHAMDTLHRHNYDLAAALCSLVPSSGPVLCRDEMEEWSASEANLFEEALDKYGKDFNDIRHDFLPWKTLKNIIEYYYMWKTTDRYVQQKRVKAVEAESKLKQVYIPNYNKPNTAVTINNTTKGLINGSSNGMPGDPLLPQYNKPCESCNCSTSTSWYPWGLQHLHCRLCSNCWQYWKKYGGLQVPSKFGEQGSSTVIAECENDEMMDDAERISASGTPSAINMTTHGGGSSTMNLVLPPTNLSTANIMSGPPANLSTLGLALVGGTLGVPTSQVMSNRPYRCTIAGCFKEFKLKTQLNRHYATTHGIVIRSGSPRPIMKTRTAFYLLSTPITRISRKLCRGIMRTRHAARSPFYPINVSLIKQECAQQLHGKTVHDLKILLTKRHRPRGNVTLIATRLAIRKFPQNGTTNSPYTNTPQWLILTDKTLLPKPDRVMFPKPPQAADGTLLYERVPNKPELSLLPSAPHHGMMSHPLYTAHPLISHIHNHNSPHLPDKMLPNVPVTLSNSGVPIMPQTHNLMPSSNATNLKRRHYEMDTNGIDGVYGSLPSSKRMVHSKEAMLMSNQIQPTPYPATAAALMHQNPSIVSGTHIMPRHISQVNGKPKIAHMTRTGSGRKHVISWMDAPDDVYFRVTEDNRRLRKQFSIADLRKAARKPWRSLKANAFNDHPPLVILE